MMVAGTPFNLGRHSFQARDEHLTNPYPEFTASPHSPLARRANHSEMPSLVRLLAVGGRPPGGGRRTQRGLSAQASRALVLGVRVAPNPRRPRSS